MDELTLDRMRLDIADVLEVDVASVVAGENLVDLGVDSIRIMALAQRWSLPGIRIEFDELASYPELTKWWETVMARRAGGTP